MSSCNKRCDICTIFMVFDNNFKCTATGKYYKVKRTVKRTLSCNSVNVIYLIICQCCKSQYAGSSITFKERFRIHKSDINTGKKRCSAAKHFLECCTSKSKFDNLKIQLIESVNVPDILLEQKLWQREKYCQAQLFTLSHGLNFSSDWYCLNRKGCRKLLVKVNCLCQLPSKISM